MRVNFDPSVARGLAANERSGFFVAKTLQRLSTGLRINRASDDAAGLSISEKLRTHVRGSQQAAKNAQDAMSLVKIAEGALNEIHNLLQRGRELAVQAASDTLSDTERGYIQEEIGALIDEIDRINDTANFNRRNVLASGVAQAVYDEIVLGLKTSWLEQAEARILAQYGIQADNVALTVKIDEEIASALAYVSYNVAADGKGFNLELHIDAGDFDPAALPNGGTAPYYNDRIISHEMVHAIMARTMNFYSLPTWFKEGTAEFIHGADERVAGDQLSYTNQQIVDAIGDGTDATWVGDSVHYSAGYIACRYLHERIQAAGGAGTQDIIAYLNANQTDTLDDALRNIANGSYAGGLNGFVADYRANGAAFIASDINTGNADTGAIGGFDTGDNGVLTATTVVPDVANFQDDPLASFTTAFSENEGLLKLHIGANNGAGDEIELTLTDASAQTLGVDSINVGFQAGAAGAIGSFDSAIELVSDKRVTFGVVENRLHVAINNLMTSAANQQFSETQIRDTDFAEESTKLSRNQILSQSSLSMIAQGNMQRGSVLALLRT